MSNIEIGMFVTGNEDSGNCYGFTTDKGLFYVNKEDESGNVQLVTIARKDGREGEIGEDYWVDPSYFIEVDDPTQWIRDNANVVMDEEKLKEYFTHPEKVEKVEGDGSTEKKGEEMAEKEIIYNKDELIEEATQLLVHGFNGEEFDYNVSDYGLGCVMDTWHENKESLEKILARNPNFIPEKHYIAIPKSEFHRGIDRGQVKKFCEWAQDHITRPEQVYLSAWSFREADRYVDFCSDIIGKMQRLSASTYSPFDPNNIVRVNGRTVDDWISERRFFISIRNMYENDPEITIRGSFAYRKKEIENYNVKSNFFNIVEKFFLENKDLKDGKATEKLASDLNAIASKLDIDLQAVAGQKVSRIVGKFSKAIGLDKVVEMGNTYSGREKDFGYNYQYALFSDAINVLTFDQTLVISVNPIDYWTMSFGHSWQSCHTIDKEGKRKASHEDDTHNYSGMYSSGTESYMLDSVSMIVYTVDSKWDNGSLMNLEKADKMKRCVFCFGEEKLIQSRVYPDGRNNSEEGITDNSFATELRNIIQKVFADCLGVPNMWVLRNGTNACEKVTCSSGTHYRDYLSYSDCNVSLLKRADGTVNENYIEIGHDPICPNCGEEHDCEDNICCNECQNSGKVQCAACGDWIDPEDDDVVYCDDNGNYYCNEYEADDAGVHYCNDDGEWHDEDNCYQDSYTDEWFTDTSEMVSTEDGNYYMNTDNAESDGYTETSDGEWYPQNQVHYCEHCERYVHDNNWNDELNCCCDCEDEVAEENREENDNEHTA